jgi:hypothetical protein
MNDIEEGMVMGQTRRRSNVVVRRCIQNGELFRRKLSAEVGL